MLPSFNHWDNLSKLCSGRVRYLLDIPDPEAAGFFLQQAVEKFLRAFLISKGWELQRIHDLEALLNMALKRDPTVVI